MAILRKKTSQIILHVSNGDIDSGLRQLMDAINLISPKFAAKS